MPAEFPTLRVAIGGSQVSGALSVRLEQSAWFRAGRFIITFAMGDLPLWNASAYAALSMQTIIVEMSNTVFGYVSVFTGQVDNVTIDFGSQRATVSGRDLSARMIDTETTETFINQTASDIAYTIAGRHGLIADIVATSDIVGQYYQLDHARSALLANSHIGNEWDLVVWLAQAENYSASVNGTTLYFGPRPVLEPISINPQDCIELSIDRALTLPVSATVKSWNTRNKAVFTQTAGGGNMTTNLVRPNLSNEQALSVARSHLAALNQHQTMLELRIPGELTLTPATPIFLSGTNSSLDQVYNIDELVRELDTVHGFVETIRAYAAN